MRKLIFISIALFSVLSCTKMESELKESKPIVFSASIDEAKTSVSAVDGKVQWIIGDVITISDGTNTGVYSVAGIDEHRFATFTYKSGTQFTAAGTYSATYGNVNDQWYSANDGSNCPMSAAGVSAESGDDCKFTFTNDCGVVAVTANTGDIKIAKIMIGDKSLNFANPKALDGTYLVAVPAGEAFTSVTFVKADGSKASKTISSTSVEQNVKRGLNTGNYFSTATYSGFEPIALPGTFTINASGNKVRFSAGNLYYDGSVFKFEANQYDYRTWPISGNNNAIINGASIETPSGHTGHMKTRAEKSTMVSKDNNDGAIPSSSEDILFAKSTNSEIPGWRMLTGNTNNEWNYLLDKRSTQQLGTTTNARWAPVTVCGVIGLIILPDSYTWPDGVTIPAKINTFSSGSVTSYDSVAFEKLQAAGIVFLPAAGYRNGTTMYNVGEYVNYMGVGLNGINVYHVYLTTWNWQGGTQADTGNYGRAIRLVTDM